jgi:UDP-N-acetylglucosamine acyltransferase
MIHNTAIVDAKAKIANDVTIGPYSIIGGDVEIGSGTWIGPHVVIDGHTKIGSNNKIFQFAAIGAAPQHKQYKGEPTTVEIGNENVFHEFCTVHRGTMQGHAKTVIGDRNFLMAYTHVAHDCILGNDNIFANNASLAGHVTVGNNVGLGAFVKVLQFCTIGAYCFITSDTDVAKDVLPYVLVSDLHGDVKTYGLNLVGLKRLGFSKENLHALKQAYLIICRKNLVRAEILIALEAMLPLHPEIKPFLDIYKNSKRGVIR